MLEKLSHLFHNHKSSEFALIISVARIMNITPKQIADVMSEIPENLKYMNQMTSYMEEKAKQLSEQLKQ